LGRTSDIEEYAEKAGELTDMNKVFQEAWGDFVKN